MQKHRGKISIDSGSNTERWKAVRGFWDGSYKVNGGSGSGVVVEGVDTNKWITISKIAVPLGIGTAMTAEMVGLCVLTCILDFVLNKSLSMKNISPVMQLSGIIECGLRSDEVEKYHVS